MTVSPAASTVDPAEAAKFAAMAESWWDPKGKFAPLHKFNPVRVEFIRDQVARHFGRDPLAPRPLRDLRLLDIGCGGGLLAEPMSRLGAGVTGIDAVDRNIGTAKSHAEAQDLAIDYRCTTAEDLAATGAQYDVILAMEVIEHVADPALFHQALAQLLAPGGIAFFATLNRTAKSYLLAIVGAEYVLRWLPRGTHDWRRFVKPSELAAHIRQSGLDLLQIQGVRYVPWRDQWELTTDLDVNYMAVARKMAVSIPS